ncbi:hypothetical protein L202_05605 [Cryptococcus amylolentus CBS 6039]|uniref:Pali-domain-containing protein n=1 Tax=Cryptococcus amylolentus CBS 6039 TaxID=1295533 RepID=A0A1E3HL48_9TREE|nr:hypothetical protein L202_05605 [Cryptococcus amylolentus CBS 6039]ODN77068.1 hypothetical protein L202_05605 [Cryptococcus amylolentus CBS 6039]
MLAKAALPTLFFTLAAFILLLLVTLSVPIIKSIYLLRINGSISLGLASGKASVDAGVLGLCYTGAEASILGVSVHDDGSCNSPELGYSVFDNPIIAIIIDNNSDLSHTTLKNLTKALVLNPIACGLAGLALFTALFAWLCASRVFEIITFFTVCLASLIAWLAFALDLAIPLVARHKINDDDDSILSASLGNAMWLALVGAILLTLSICLAGCGVFGRYSSRRRNADAEYVEKPGFQPKRRFWQRAPSAGRGTY